LLAELKAGDCVTCENIYFLGKRNFIIFATLLIFQERERERRERERKRERKRERCFIKDAVSF
jgi:hypothetical protein